MAARTMALITVFSCTFACGVGVFERSGSAEMETATSVDSDADDAASPAPGDDDAASPSPGDDGAPSSPSTAEPLCGNQSVESGETCDGGTKLCAEVDAAAFAGGDAVCSSDCSAWETNACVPIAPEVTIDEAVASITQEEMKADLERISSDEFAGRYPGSEGDQKTLDFISERFKEYGLEPGNGSSYLQKFTWRSRETANPIGVLFGNDPELEDEVVLIGAHHDHLGTTSDSGCSSGGGNEICNGADDNGTGTIAVVHVAKALSQLEGKNRRTLVFMTFGAEEKGYIGSCYYVEDAPLFPIDDTVYMINLDMLGYSTSGSISALGGSASALAGDLIERVAAKHEVQPKLSQNIGSGSDHVCFSDRGVPAVAFFTGMHDCYHSTCDTAEKINYETLTNITRTAAELMWGVDQSDVNPRADFDAGVRSVGLDRERYAPVAEEEFRDHEGMPTAEEIDALP